jgi:CRP-like cAMP-binding protein
MEATEVHSRSTQRGLHAMDSINPNYFIHVANILLLVAYSVRDILWLRLFAVAASVISIPFFILQPATLWAPLAWTVVFAAINLFQSSRILVERRPVKLTPEEQEVGRCFKELSPRQLLQVIAIGSWKTIEAGAVMLKQGQRAEAVSLILRGRVRATKGNLVLGELANCDLVGSALLLSGVSAQVDVVAIEPVRALAWEIGTIERYLAANPEIRTIMLGHLSRDLAAKLTGLGRDLSG